MNIYIDILIHVIDIYLMSQKKQNTICKTKLYIML